MALSLVAIAGCDVQPDASTRDGLTAGSGCSGRTLQDPGHAVEGGYVLVHAPIQAGRRERVDAAVADLHTAMNAVAGLAYVASPRDEGGEQLQGPDGHTAILQYSTTGAGEHSSEVLDTVELAVRDSADAHPELDIEHFDGASSSWPWRKSPVTPASPGASC